MSLRIAVDQQLVAACTDAHVEKRFEVFDVLILNAEKRVEALRWKFEFSKIAQIKKFCPSFITYFEATKTRFQCQSISKK